MQTSQIAGSFYAERGRRLLLNSLPARMLDPVDAYDRIRDANVEGAVAEYSPKPTLIVAQ